MPGSMSVGGVVSGLDTNSIIAKAVEYARRPIANYEGDIAVNQQKLAIWQDINTRMLAVKMSTESLARPATFQAKTAESSNESILTATASTDAVSGVYDLRVEQRAQAHQIAATDTYSSTDAVVGEGTFEIVQANGDSFSVELDANNNTLSALKNKINSENEGVSASIVNVGTSDTPEYKLLLKASDTGTDYEITAINTSGWSGGTAPTFDLMADPVQEAQDAIIKLGSGAGELTVTKSTNTITDVVPGVTLNITGADAGENVAITVGKDTTGAKAAIQGFVEAYNTLMSAIDDQFDYDADTGASGSLMGSYQLQAVQSDIQDMISRSVPGLDKEFSSLSSIGITLDQTGLLTVNQSELDDALANNIDKVEDLFSYRFESDSSYVSMVATSSSTDASNGDWQVRINQVATRSNAQAGTELNGNLAQDETLTINGESVSLTAGMSMQDVIDAINSKTEDTNVVAYETVDGADSYLTLRSRLYGDNHDFTAVSSVSNTVTNSSGIGNVSVSGENAAGESGTGTGAKGVDVEGQIFDGDTWVNCKGNGQILTADPDDEYSPVKGLVLMATYDTLPADDINVSYAKGFGASIRDKIGEMTGTDGVVTSAQESLNTEIDDIKEYIVDLEERLSRYEERMYEQFNAMETKLANLKQQSSYLFASLGQSSE